MKKKFTVEFYDHPSGGYKAAVFEGNRFLFDVHGWTEYGVFQRIATVYAFYDAQRNEMSDYFNRRAD